MKPKRMNNLGPANRIRSKCEARRVLRDAKKIAKRLLSLESIPDIREGVDKLESNYRMAIQRSSGDEKLYKIIREDAICRFSIIADYVRDKFGPGELVNIIEKYKSRHIPVYSR